MCRHPHLMFFSNLHFFNFFIFIFCALVFCLYVCLSEDVGSPGTGVTDNYKLSGGGRELNLGPLEEQPALLNFEPSLQLVMLI